jgi:hypothetical protein
MSPFPDSMIAAAKFERDRRAERFPALVAAGKLGEDEATVEYQCWCVIADWIEGGTFTPIYDGGADERTAVDWALAEDVSAKALAKITAKLAKQEAENPAHPELAEGHRRRANLVCIHRAVQLRRQSIESINRQFRQRRERAQQELAA